ncbi:unnamed protein product [Ambrosiozyma monospora]|uniref:H/ACA ribonucleoprotein complex non-core subunit NAF1 n=1 Tax=Ambrosiozyma monospora TaxID=43982 RepID=A0A9W6Z1F8_AMBMO|nr:unnamed protein product [Ambrosiozyma monospora]
MTSDIMPTTTNEIGSQSEHTAQQCVQQSESQPSIAPDQESHKPATEETYETLETDQTEATGELKSSNDITEESSNGSTGADPIPAKGEIKQSQETQSSVTSEEQPFSSVNEMVPVQDTKVEEFISGVGASEVSGSSLSDESADKEDNGKEEKQAITEVNEKQKDVCESSIPEDENQQKSNSEQVIKEQQEVTDNMDTSEDKPISAVPDMEDPTSANIIQDVKQENDAMDITNDSAKVPDQLSEEPAKKLDDDIFNPDKEMNYSSDELENDSDSSDDDDDDDSDDNDSDSDDSSSDESDADTKNKRVIEDMDSDADEGPIVSKNEIVDEKAPVLPEDFTIAPDEPIQYIGTTTGFVERSVLIKGASSAEFRVLKEGAIFCFEDRTPLGPMFEIFGQLQSPVYRVKFNTVEEFEKQKDRKGERVYYVVSKSEFVLTSDIKAIKGSDASAWNDEELPLEQQEFSDDEKEAAAKSAKKKRKNKNKKKNNSNDNKKQKLSHDSNKPPGKQLPNYMKARLTSLPVAGSNNNNNKPGQQPAPYPQAGYQPLPPRPSYPQQSTQQTAPQPPMNNQMNPQMMQQMAQLFQMAQQQQGQGQQAYNPQGQQQYPQSQYQPQYNQQQQHQSLQQYSYNQSGYQQGYNAPPQNPYGQYSPQQQQLQPSHGNQQGYTYPPQHQGQYGGGIPQYNPNQTVYPQFQQQQQLGSYPPPQQQQGSYAPPPQQQQQPPAQSYGGDNGKNNDDDGYDPSML